MRSRRADASRAASIAGRAVISGVGQSDVGRRLGRSALDLTIQACRCAVADAGLQLSDIDGISTFPGRVDNPPGLSEVGAPELHDALRLDLAWYSGGIEQPGQLGAVVTAAAVVSAGLARHVLCFRTVTEATAQGDRGRSSVTPGHDGGRCSGWQQWLLPFGSASPANWLAVVARRHMHDFGTTREQLGQIALVERANAALNPTAIFREPLSMEQYLNARPVSTPFCLYDCDVPVDGSVAVIVSAAATTPDLRRPPLRIEATGTALHGRNSWDQYTDPASMAARDAGAALWRATDIKPSDVGMAGLYDGFSFLALVWLEGLGFCGRGESGPFVEGGFRISRSGELPLNTHGGQLSAGRLHGYGQLQEACLQAWGEAGDRQLQPAPEVVVAAAGGGPLAGCLLLAAS